MATIAQILNDKALTNLLEKTETTISLKKPHLGVNVYQEHQYEIPQVVETNLVCTTPARSVNDMPDDRVFATRTLESFSDYRDMNALDALYYYHPYSGLNDSRGSLTRYKPEEGYTTALSDGWVADFLHAGGTFDTYGVYGIYPYASDEYPTHWAESCEPELLAQHLKMFGRCDFNFQIPELGFYDAYQLAMSIHRDWDLSGETERDQRAKFHRVARGIDRKRDMEKYGCSKIPSVLSLGWMSLDKFIRILLERAECKIKNGRFCGRTPEFLLSCLDGGETYWGEQKPLWSDKNKAPQQVRYMAECGRKNMKREETNPYRQSFPVSIEHSIKSVKTLMKWGKLAFRHEFKTLKYCLNDEKATNTSVGPMYVSRDGFPYFHHFIPNVRTFQKEVDGTLLFVKTFRVEDTYFVCNPANLLDHIEAKSLRDGLDKWIKRDRKMRM